MEQLGWQHQKRETIDVDFAIDTSHVKSFTNYSVFAENAAPIVISANSNSGKTTVLQRVPAGSGRVSRAWSTDKQG